MTEGEMERDTDGKTTAILRNAAGNHIMRPFFDVDALSPKRSPVLPAFGRFREDEEEIVEEVHVLDMPTDEEMKSLRTAFWHPYSKLAARRHTELPYVFERKDGGQPVYKVFAVREKGETRMLDRWLRANGSRFLRVVSSKVISHEEAERKIYQIQMDSEKWRPRFQFLPPPERNPSIPPGAPWRPLRERTREERTDRRDAEPSMPDFSAMNSFNIDTGVELIPERLFERPRFHQGEEGRRSTETRPTLRTLTVEERLQQLAEWGSWERQRRESLRRTMEEIERIRTEREAREIAQINMH